MLGNVWEWCLDAYGPYEKVPATADPAADSADGSAFREIRGGSWFSDAWMCRAAKRGWERPVGRNVFQGFRVLLLLPLLHRPPSEPATAVRLAARVRVPILTPTRGYGWSC
jgi:hypothetical protein